MILLRLDGCRKDKRGAQLTSHTRTEWPQDPPDAAWRSLGYEPYDARLHRPGGLPRGCPTQRTWVTRLAASGLSSPVGPVPPHPVYRSVYRNGRWPAGSCFSPVPLVAARPWPLAAVSRLAKRPAPAGLALTADSAEIIEQRGGRYHQLGRSVDRPTAEQQGSRGCSRVILVRKPPLLTVTAAQCGPLVPQHRRCVIPSQGTGYPLPQLPTA
jgi:hypothetical protein